MKIQAGPQIFALYGFLSLEMGRNVFGFPSWSQSSWVQIISLIHWRLKGLSAVLLILVKFLTFQEKMKILHIAFEKREPLLNPQFYLSRLRCWLYIDGKGFWLLVLSSGQNMMELKLSWLI